MYRFILFVTLTCLVFNISSKLIEKKDQRMELTTKEEEDTNKSLEVISRSSINDDSPSNHSSKNFSMNTQTDLCSSVKDKRHCLVSLLSRIAKIQVDDDRDLRNWKKSSIKKNQKYQSNFETKKEHESGLYTDQTSGNCRCNIVQDIYVPEVGKKLPAYACRLHDKIFVLTSERFFDDRRSYFDIKVDEETSQHLITAASKPSSKTVHTKKLPVTLVLKNGEDNYRIRKKS
ncbi:uncharacterized protein LOC124950798 [Vespa velutina]|uniref:uncharacterized protein LOC124950798 n=1 Tax=Vespa velutina TaxID=202808 RepID=UPI001FB3AA74|nr:uncharacterized protein LOC124950798 [Vespa velutina]